MFTATDQKYIGVAKLLLAHKGINVNARDVECIY